MLDQLQRQSEPELWGGETPQGSVIASDFYNATAIAELSDQAIVDCLMQDLLPITFLLQWIQQTTPKKDWPTRVNPWMSSGFIPRYRATMLTCL